MSDHDLAAELPVDPARDDAGDGRWLTYAEFGKARGMTRESAKKLALKQGWRRVPGNDGANRVLVPVTWLTPRREPSRDQPHEPSRVQARQEPRDNSRDISGLQETFAAALVAMRDAHAAEVVALRAQLDLTNAMVGERDRAVAALEVALATAEAHAAAIHAELDAALAGRHEALQAADGLRQADAARKAQGLLTRLAAVLRGH